MVQRREQFLDLTVAVNQARQSRAAVRGLKSEGGGCRAGGVPCAERQQTRQKALGWFIYNVSERRVGPTP